MVTFRLHQSVDKKQHRWEFVNEYNLQSFEILTWKGIYKLANPKPRRKSGRHIFQNSTFRYMHPVAAYLWCHYGQKAEHWWYMRDPILNKPFPISRNEDEHNIYEIVERILQWVLEQPPQEEQMREVYEKDRIEVESTFAEIESLQIK